MIFVENMLKLEGGALGEVVRVSMLTKVVELLLHLDVCILCVQFDLAFFFLERQLIVET